MKREKERNILEKRGHYIAGFADGEGSFNVSFRKREDCLIGWQITPVFNISQKEKRILEIIKTHIGCGTIRFRSDHVWVYEVIKQEHLCATVIPFFKRFPFLSEKKKKDFSRFQRVIELLSKEKSLTYETVKKVLIFLQGVESKSSRKHTDHQIKERAEIFWRKNSQRIETLNQKKPLL